MKKIILFLFFISFGFFTHAQISEGGNPYSSKYNLRSEIPVIELPSFDVDLQRKIDDEEMKLGEKPFRFAKPFDLGANLTNSGLWETLTNGDKLWRIKIVSPGAYSLNVIFNEYVLPEGAKLFLYNSDRTYTIGAFTNKNNKKSNILPTELIPGDEIIVEYFEPKKVDFEGRLQIGRVGHDYRGILKLDNQYGQSGACNVDINCPEGAAWQKEKRAICRMVINSAELCTGGLIANTNKDDTPYFFTANHCIDVASDANNTVFYFNYESPSCDGPDGSTSQTISGSSLIATTTNLDFSLVLLSSDPPESYSPYFLGWDRSGEPVTGAVAIHHPQGDVKKIAIDNDKLSMDSYPDDYDPNTHWVVERWDLATTEGGSSGCPLLDLNGRVIGDLTGGYATCTNPVLDYFQRFYNSWDDYPDNANQLKHWLDPINSGAQFMDGYDPYQPEGEPVECISVSNVQEDHTPTLYYATDGGGNDFGYIAGNNGYGDLAKADYYSAEVYGNRTVIDGLYLWFGVAKGGTTPITFGIWEDSGGEPGDLIGSGVITLTDIIIDIENEEYTYVDIDPFVVIPGPFYAGVVLPQNVGDTLALVTNEEGDSPVNTAWEMFSNGAWEPYDGESSWGLALSHAIYPVVCNLSTAIPELNRMEEELLNVFPNPASGKITIDASLLQDEDYTIQIFSTLGNNLMTIQKTKYDSFTELDFSNYQNGLYLVHFIRADGQRIVKKVVVEK